MIRILPVLFLVCTSIGYAQAPIAPQDPNSPAEPSGLVKPSEVAKPMKEGAGSPSGRNERLAKYLSGATFTGSFTMGKASQKADAKLKKESYTIRSCEVLDTPDTYRLKVGIKYGDVDGEFPMDLNILWSGKTPVITLDAFWIPGLGTFSSRVLIHDGRYAGTWQHDDKGGHLFGTIAPKE